MNIVKYSPDGLRVASGSNDSYIKIWDVPNLRLIKTINAGTNYMPVLTIDFSPDGSMIASGGDDREIKIWDATGDEYPLLQSKDGYLSSIYEVKFSKDSGKLALGYSKVTVYGVSGVAFKCKSG